MLVSAAHEKVRVLSMLHCGHQRLLSVRRALEKTHQVFVWQPRHSGCGPHRATLPRQGCLRSHRSQTLSTHRVKPPRRSMDSYSTAISDSALQATGIFFDCPFPLLTLPLCEHFWFGTCFGGVCHRLCSFHVIITYFPVYIDALFSQFDFVGLAMHISLSVSS